MQMAHNMSQPAWVTRSVTDRLDVLDAFNWDLESWTDEMVSLRAGELVRNVMLNFLHAILPIASASASASSSSASASSASELSGLVPERKTKAQRAALGRWLQVHDVQRTRLDRLVDYARARRVQRAPAALRLCRLPRALQPERRVRRRGVLQKHLRQQSTLLAKYAQYGVLVE